MENALKVLIAIIIAISCIMIVFVSIIFIKLKKLKKQDSDMLKYILPRLPPISDNKPKSQ